MSGVMRGTRGGTQGKQEVPGYEGYQKWYEGV